NTSEFNFTKVDLNTIVNQVLSDMEDLIEKNKAKIIVKPLPVIDANVSQMGQLFQNLICNSLKFSKSDSETFIEISAEEVLSSSLPQNNGSSNGKEKLYKIYVKDNGIGF